MSFKRDGDDINLLNNLKHKRVAEVLGDHVPDDEAKLLSNGRLTCLICNHRPIFDNMKILTIHRKGKRHIYELSRYLEHKYKLEMVKSKKLQMENIKKEKFEGSLGGGILFQDGRKRHISLIGPTLPTPAGQSCASKVRRYLKEISRKTPMSQVVSDMKESYPEVNQSEQSKEEDVSTSNLADSIKINDEVASSCIIDGKNIQKNNNELLSLHMSGWIRDRFGNLVKDPNAEFDSDDD